MGQSKQILNYLEQGHSITPMDALEKFSCFRLGARIYDLKKKGYNIEAQIEKKGNKTYARYYLKNDIMGKLQDIAIKAKDEDDFLQHISKSDLSLIEVENFLKSMGFESLEQFYLIYIGGV